MQKPDIDLLIGVLVTFFFKMQLKDQMVLYTCNIEFSSLNQCFFLLGEIQHL